MLFLDNHYILFTLPSLPNLRAYFIGESQYFGSELLFIHILFPLTLLVRHNKSAISTLKTIAILFSVGRSG